MIQITSEQGQQFVSSYHLLKAISTSFFSSYSHDLLCFCSLYKLLFSAEFLLLSEFRGKQLGFGFIVFKQLNITGFRSVNMIQKRGVETARNNSKANFEDKITKNSQKIYINIQLTCMSILLYFLTSHLFLSLGALFKLFFKFALRCGEFKILYQSLSISL